VCLNVIYADSTDADPKQWLVTQALVEAEIVKSRKTKAGHEGRRVNEKLLDF
jgi:hypothetical protein